MLPRQCVYRYPSGCNNIQDAPVQNIAGGMMSYEMGGLPLRDVLPLMPIHAFSIALANAPYEQYRTMLGEALYPLVDQLEHDSAAKVTGMLL
ncbi:hypothetical protein RYX36_022839 [Vicia faba]